MVYARAAAVGAVEREETRDDGEGGVFKGTKRKLGSSDARVAVGVGAGEIGNVTGGETGHVARETEGVRMASAAAAEMAGGGSAPSLDRGAVEPAASLDEPPPLPPPTPRPPARCFSIPTIRTAPTAPRVRLGGFDGCRFDARAEGEAARGWRVRPRRRAASNAMRAVVLERAAEAEGNRKVSAATSGRVAFQSLPDGRLVERHAVPDVGDASSADPASARRL